MGSRRASCLLMSGERGCSLWGKRGDSRRACPIPESSESMLTSESERERVVYMQIGIRQNGSTLANKKMPRVFQLSSLDEAT